MFASTHTVALNGAVGHLVDVQADVSPGMPGLTLVGRADLALTEGRDRVRMAVVNSGLEWPSTRRTTVLLSPADLPKSGTHYDLAMAVAILAAAGTLDTAALDACALIGEVSLDGGLRPVTGVLPMVLAARQRDLRRVIVPEPQAREAAMVPGMEVLGLRSLAQVVAELRGEEVPPAPPVPAGASGQILGWRGEDRLEEVDLADLVGMREVRFAIEVAAAGGHHILLRGPKGCGKTSIAERVATILPDLEPDVAVELMAVQSLAGVLDPVRGLLRRPPFTAPHHDASKASLVGGGHPRVRPGQISLAHGGVLFLDEFPMFRADVIEALREPLESGDITIARAEEMVTMPAHSLVVLAANPCPCGNHSADVNGEPCTCREVERREYGKKITGPIADRIDITRHVRPLQPHEYDPGEVPESSAAVRERVVAARERQAERYADCGWRLNGQATSTALRERWPLVAAGQAELDQLVFAGKLSRRGAVRVHRLAWTVADLAGVAVPGVREVHTALRLRSGDPLLADDYHRRRRPVPSRHGEPS
ncbi:MAG: YifB family Mg chelatase-like AAA ATPase [Nocardioides sp.]|uniref:YifB family Mg chelatase-like AAA ATPase n=1 Tax=Nocardioides sp. TaxID=35761 RepID=UPI0039E621D1